jgi:hypothetical protein
MLLEPKPIVGGIEQACQTKRGVDSKTRDLAAGLDKFELEQVVGETRDDADVVEEPANAVTHGNRRDVGVAARDRAQHPIVELEVESEHRLVEARQRIGIDALILTRRCLNGRGRLRCRVLRQWSGVLAKRWRRKRNDCKQGRCEHHPERACPFEVFRTRCHFALSCLPMALSPEQRQKSVPVRAERIHTS